MEHPIDDSWADIVPAPVPPEPEDDTQERLQKAASRYRRRKSRLEHPAGHFDKQQRWWPSGMEEQSCCRGIRSPSAKYPYSLMVHCRTVEHVAHLFGIDPEALRKYLKPPKVKTPNPHRRLRGPTVWDKLGEPDTTANPSLDASVSMAQP